MEKTSSHKIKTQDIWQFCKFTASSLITTAVEFIFFWLALKILDYVLPSSNFKLFYQITAATIFARIFSGITNYFLNKIWSFKSPKKSPAEMVRFALLFAARLLLSSLFVTLLTPHVPKFVIFNETIKKEVPAKLVVDLALFFANFYLQKMWVFRKKEEKPVEQTDLQTVKQTVHQTAVQPVPQSLEHELKESAIVQSPSQADQIAD